MVVLLYMEAVGTGFNKLVCGSTSDELSVLILGSKSDELLSVLILVCGSTSDELSVLILGSTSDELSV